MGKRQYSKLDNIIMQIDAVLRDSSKSSEHSTREYPGDLYPHSDLNEQEKRHVSGLMRINHAGEISAQALYKAQAMTAIDDELKDEVRITVIATGLNSNNEMDYESKTETIFDTGGLTNIGKTKSLNGRNQDDKVSSNIQEEKNDSEGSMMTFGDDTDMDTPTYLRGRNL